MRETDSALENSRKQRALICRAPDGPINQSLRSYRRKILLGTQWLLAYSLELGYEPSLTNGHWSYRTIKWYGNFWKPGRSSFLLPDVLRRDDGNVSPSYAALFADLMPRHSRERILRIRTSLKAFLWRHQSTTGDGREAR